MRKQILLATLLAIAPALSAQAWKADFDQAETGFSSLLKLRVAQGYRLSYASARKGPSGNRFELLWTEDANSMWKVSHGLGHTAFQALLASLGKQADQ